MDSRKRKGKMTRREFVAASTAGLTLAGRLVAGQPAPGLPGDAPQLPTAAQPARVIIDTDPGVDDALALLFAMRSPELKIEAICAVPGNVPAELTLANALRMVEISGRTDIPVARGAEGPLVRRLVTAEYAHGRNGLDGVVFPKPKIKPVAKPAAVLIRDIVRKYPGEVTLIPVGPLTNIATALRLDDELAGMVKGIHIMGGSLSGGNITPAAEFNIYVDPEAARIVFQSGIPVTMIGLDVTRKTALTEEHVKRLEAAQNPSSQAAGKIARNAIEHTRKQGFMAGPNMHDSLAVASFIDPSIVTLKDYYVDIETSGELTAGETVGYSPTAGDLRRSPEMEKQAEMNMKIRGSARTLTTTQISPVIRDKYVPNARVGVEVDSPKYFELLIGRLTGSKQ